MIKTPDWVTKVPFVNDDPKPETTRYWVRNYHCNNPNCGDGDILIQVTHSTDTKKHRCTYCGTYCEYVNDVMEVELPFRE